MSTRQDREAFAKLLVVACVRNNTSIEDLHCKGKITDRQMKALMKQCVNNVFTLLSEDSNGEYLGWAMRFYQGEMSRWDRPRLKAKRRLLSVSRRQES